MMLGESLKRVPGFGTLVLQDPDAAWKSLMRKIFDLPELKEAASSLSRDSSEISNGHANGGANGANHKEETQHTTAKLEEVLRKALLSKRLAMWPESESISASEPVVRYVTGPLSVRDTEKLVATAGDGRETLRNAVVGSISNQKGLWTYETTLANDNPACEIGWCIKHTIDGKVYQDFARLHLKTGHFKFQGHKLTYAPPNLAFGSGDLIGCFVDIDHMTFSYTLNGILLPEIAFHREEPQDDDSATPTPRSSDYGQALSSSSNSTCKRVNGDNGKCNYSFKVELGPDATVAPAIGPAQQVQKINFGQSPLLSSTGYLPVHPTDKLATLESQCNLLLSMIELIMPYTSTSSTRPANTKNSPMRRQMHSLSSHTDSIPRDKLHSLIDIIVNSESVGLFAIFKDVDFFGGDHQTGYPHHSHVICKSILPFLLRLLRKEQELVSQNLLGSFVDMMQADGFREAISHIIGELCSKLANARPGLTLRRPELVSIAENTTWTEWMELLVAMAGIDKVFEIISDTGLMHPILSYLFDIPLLDHRIRIDPYIAHADVYLLDQLPSEEYLKAFATVREEIQLRTDRLGTLAALLGSKLVKTPKEPSKDIKKHENGPVPSTQPKQEAGSSVLPEESSPQVPTTSTNGEQASSSSHVSQGDAGAGADASTEAVASPSSSAPSTPPVVRSSDANTNADGAANSNNAPSTPANRSRLAAKAYVLPANAFIEELRKLINNDADCLRNRVISAHTSRAKYNGLFYALLSAIATSSQVKTHGIFSNCLIGNVLLDPARAVVDRLGGTFGHVKSNHPDALGEAISELSPYPEVQYPDVETNWRFEFLDACQYILHYSVIPSIARTQEYGNNIETSNRMKKNVARTRSRREAAIASGDLPPNGFSDLDMIDLVNIENVRHSSLQCMVNAMQLLDQHQVFLLHQLSVWVSQVVVNTISHPTRSQLVHYFPEFYPQTLVILEHVFHLAELGSPLSLVCSWDVPPDDELLIPVEDRNTNITDSFPYRHGNSTHALCTLLSKDLILNPNMQEFIINHLATFVNWSIENPERILSPKRIAQVFDVFVMGFSDAKKGFWSQIVGGLISILLGSSPTSKTYQEAFCNYLNAGANLKKVESMLNTVFNLISWAENELETHIDNFLEKLKLICSNIDTLIADPAKDPDFPDRPESRGGRAPPTEERGFRKSLAKDFWELADVSGSHSGADPKVLVVLPTEDEDNRVHVIRSLVMANVTGNNAFEVIVRELPAYSVVLMNLLLMLSQIAKHALHLFESPLIMTRTCEAVGHSLRRILDPSSSPPIVKLLRLFGRTIQPDTRIKFKYTNNYDFWSFDAKKLVWICTAIGVTLIRNEGTRPSFLQLLHGLLPNHVIDVYMQLEFKGINDWGDQKAQFEAIKTTTSREVLLRSNQEECPICYTNPVNTTFEPCNHRSCSSCIDRHLLNNKQCFFCKADIVSTRRD